ncbi:MAG: exopolysaccharide transport family protein [Planctomycetota bacterium]|jgi:capsular exopolysaccharide synthesis family protein
MAQPETIGDFILMLRRQWKLIVLILVLYFAIVYIYLITRPSWYHADFQVILETSQNEGKELREVFRGLWQEETIENAMELIKSMDVLQLLLQNDPTVNYESLAQNRNSLFWTLESYQSRVKTQKINPRSFSVMAYDPEYIKCADFAALLSSSFLEFTREKRQKNKIKYRNRLYRRLGIIKKFLEKAQSEFNLLKEEDDRKAALAKSEQKRKDLDTALATAKRELESAKSYFHTQQSEIKDRLGDLRKDFFPEWPELKELEKRKKILDRIIMATDEAQLASVKEDISSQSLNWYDRKSEELLKLNREKELKNDLSDTIKKIQLDNEALLEIQKEIEEKRSEMQQPTFPEEMDNSSDVGAENAGGETPPADDSAGKTKADVKKELKTQQNVREKQAELLWISQIKELDNSTNPPNFNKETIREKVSALKQLAASIQGDLSKIESILETEKSPYSIMNLMPYARKASLTERQPMIMLLFVGFVLAIGLAVLMEYLRGIPASEGLIERVSKMEVLEVIPDMLRAAAHQGREITASDLPILCHLGFLPGISDRFRIVKAKLLMKLNNPQKLSLIITSCGPQEGKSTCAGNIAVAFAEMGFKTLLCSCNLRRPTLEKSLQISATHGMSEILAGEMAWQELVHTTEIFNLYLIPSGSIPRDSSKLIFTKEFRTFFEQAKKVFDVVILDTPPILMVVDAMILSRMVDGIVLVYAPERTPVEALTKVKKQVADINIPILGIIVNWFESKRGEGGLMNRLKGYSYGGRGYGIGYRGGYGYGYGQGYGQGYGHEQEDGKPSGGQPEGSEINR